MTDAAVPATIAGWPLALMLLLLLLPPMTPLFPCCLRLCGPARTRAEAAAAPPAAPGALPGPGPDQAVGQGWWAQPLPLPPQQQPVCEAVWQWQSLVAQLGLLPKRQVACSMRDATSMGGSREQGGGGVLPGGRGMEGSSCDAASFRLRPHTPRSAVTRHCSLAHPQAYIHQPT